MRRARGAAGALGNPFPLPFGAAGERYRPAACQAHEMLVRAALRAPASVSVERLAAREWRLADGSRGTLQVDCRYTRGERPNFGAEIRAAVAELVELVRAEQTEAVWWSTLCCGSCCRNRIKLSRPAPTLPATITSPPKGPHDHANDEGVQSKSPDSLPHHHHHFTTSTPPPSPPDPGPWA